MRGCPWVEPTHGSLGPGRKHGDRVLLALWVLWGVNGSVQEGAWSGTDTDYGHGSQTGTGISSFFVDRQEVWGRLEGGLG